MSNVKLGIRVRPFTDRELKNDKNRIPVVTVADDHTITITNVKVSVSGAGDSRERVRRYYADYTLDSALPVAHPDYASQEKVFDTIGRQVIESVSRGSPTCVLAYGQSATGKTHTMMGSDDDPGLVPRICRALTEVQPFDLTVSFLEIYNERVHDLLAGETAAPPTCHSLPRRRGNARKDLRVREHPSRGPYVQNLRRVAITDVAALLALVTEGARRRRTAATRRNSTSSRSHAILEIATPTATLHLADLAGSEKAGWEGCGGRQKEGANINKSLVALSNVISALVGGRGRFVPYRDSALTWLLKDCFTGGASTFIIATVSPSVACYGESASTLRWAERARQLPRPRAPAVAGRLALQAQYNHLLAELSRNYIRYVPETGKISYDDNHWNLNTNVEQFFPKLNKETAKIGNIMNLLHPKADAQSSTASSAASGSSDVINAMDKNIKIDISNEISKEVDKLFGPALERTQSNSDLKVIAPIRHKRRQYRSQEILPIVEKMQVDSTVANVLPSQSEAQIDDIRNIEKPKVPQIPILYDSQRAEIVASVTERLYNKIKKKEEAATSKMESVIDKKIMEPLNELKICTNARQRLMEISQKALRNKRRIGIPAHTQTRKMVTRVRDQGIDVQTDLETYVVKNKHSFTLCRDAATETIPLTPRCKEIAVGSINAMLHFHDRSTITEGRKITYRNSITMTDIVTKCDRTTQTQVVPPPRRKRRTVCKCMQNSERSKGSADSLAPIISINISQIYPPDSESQTSDDNSDDTKENNNCTTSESVNMTPDLLTNHSTIEPGCSKSIKSDHRFNVHNNNEGQEIEITNNTPSRSTLKFVDQNNDEDFSDTEDCVLPRVTVNGLKRVDSNDLKDMILGRNENVYPYNIVLSPPRAIDSTKRLVTFQDDTIPATSVASQTTWETQNKSTKYELNHHSEGMRDAEDCEAIRINYQDAPTNSFSDSTESSKAESDSFVWKNGRMVSPSHHRNKRNSLDQTYAPVTKGVKYAKAKAKLYREFLGLDKEENYVGSSSSKNNDLTSTDSVDSRDVSNLSFRRRKNVLEDKLKFRCKDSFKSLEQQLMNSCNSLESSVNKYEGYLSGYYNGKSGNRTEGSRTRTPTEYLQHLVQLRRQVIKGDCDTDSSLEHAQNK